MSVKSSLLAQNRALYLPAISETFAKFVHAGSFSQALALTAADLDFLNPNNSQFFYPFALYSAGQAAPSAGNQASACMVTQRVREETLVVGDSGGFQIQTGAIAFDRSSTAPRILRWLEQTADLSMVLDFPTGGINDGSMQKHADELRAEGVDLEGLSHANGLSVEYNACLAQTQINNKLFVKERAPGTLLLNVIQGRNERESKHWYDSVKHYPFEGWAFAGANRDHFSLIVRRLLDMRDEGRLSNCRWIHVLGASSLYIGCLLTAVQRALGATTGVEIQFSFDSATPFKSAANHSILAGCTLDKRGWSVQYEPLSDLPPSHNDRLLGDILRDRVRAMQPERARFPAQTLVSENVRLGEIRDSGGEKLSTEGSYLVMHHNTEGLVRAHEAAHDKFFADEMAVDPLAVPFRAKVIAATVKALFTGEVIKGVEIGDPYERIDEWADWMDDLAS